MLPQDYLTNLYKKAGHTRERLEYFCLSFLPDDDPRRASLQAPDGYRFTGIPDADARLRAADEAMANKATTVKRVIPAASAAPIDISRNTSKQDGNEKRAKDGLYKQDLLKPQFGRGANRQALQPPGSADIRLRTDPSLFFVVE